MARQRLTRDRVLIAALEVADAEGLGAVTMRHVASSLGVEAMSLYHHVPGKEALLDGLVEAVVMQIDHAHACDTRPPRDDWRDAMRHRCLGARTVMTAHPWAPGLIATRTKLPPSLFLYFEGVLATMAEGGLDYHLAHRGLHALGSMVLGFVQEPFSPATAGAQADTGVSDEELAAMAETFPHLTAMMAAEAHDAGDNVLGWCDSDAEFAFTLGLLLDGLERARQEATPKTGPQSQTLQ